MRIHFFATFRPIVGGPSLEVPLEDGATVGELVDWLCRSYPELEGELRGEDGGLSRRAHVFVDGRGVRWLEEGIHTPIRGEQRIDVFPAVAGG